MEKWIRGFILSVATPLTAFFFLYTLLNLEGIRTGEISMTTLEFRETAWTQTRNLLNVIVLLPPILAFAYELLRGLILSTQKKAKWREIGKRLGTYVLIFLAFGFMLSLPWLIFINFL